MTEEKKVKTAIWCCFKASIECEPKDIPDLEELKEEIESYLLGETPFEEVRVTQMSMKSSCILCGRFGSGEHVEGETTIPLFFCKLCIKKYGYDGCKEILDRM